MARRVEFRFDKWICVAACLFVCLCVCVCVCVSLNHTGFCVHLLVMLERCLLADAAALMPCAALVLLVCLACLIGCVC